jgi:hypothetical protein
MLLGFLLLAFLWWRPIGLFPERRRRFGTPPEPLDRFAPADGASRGVP